jgi:hypothetical protein
MALELEEEQQRENKHIEGIEIDGQDRRDSMNTVDLVQSVAEMLKDMEQGVSSSQTPNTRNDLSTVSCFSVKSNSSCKSKSTRNSRQKSFHNFMGSAGGRDSATLFPDSPPAEEERFTINGQSIEDEGDDNTGGTFNLIANVQDIFDDDVIEDNTVTDTSFGSLGGILDVQIDQKDLKSSKNSAEKNLKLSINEVISGSRRSRRLSGVDLYTCMLTNL